MNKLLAVSVDVLLLVGLVLVLTMTILTSVAK